MQSLEVIGAVRPIYGSLGVKRLIIVFVLYNVRQVLYRLQKPTAVFKGQSFLKGSEQCVTHSLEAYSEGQQQGPHYMKRSHPKYVAH